VIDRHRGLAWFVFVGLPSLALVGWSMTRAANPARGLLILDVPADVAVTVEGRPLQPCKSEYRPHKGCHATPTPGLSRRYAWPLVRERAVEVVAARGPHRTTTTVTAPAEGPTPHLGFDDDTFSWRVVGGTRMEGNDAVFVDDQGRVVGPAGPSEPD
jgi:hypothetical protein